MAPHLETIDLPDGLEDQAEAALGQPFLLDGLAWGLREMVDLLAGHEPPPGAIDLGVPARALRDRLFDLDAADFETHQRAIRRTPRHLAALSRFARRTVVPAYATMADLPPIGGGGALDGLRAEFGAAVAPIGGTRGGLLPTCEELLAEAPPDHASWERLAIALVADNEADRVLRHSGLIVLSEIVDDLLDHLQDGAEQPGQLLDWVEGERDAIADAHAFAWLAAHREAWRRTSSQMARSGHRARDLTGIRNLVATGLHEAAMPCSLDLLGQLAMFVDDALAVS